MPKSIQPILFISLALGGCGVAGNGEFQPTIKIGKTSYLSNWDGTFKVGQFKLEGTGTVIASDPVAASATASVGFRLEALLPKSTDGFIELVAFAKATGKTLEAGTRVRISSENGGVLRILDRSGVIAETVYPYPRDTIDLFVDIHEGGGEVFVWTSDTQDFKGDNTLTDTVRYQTRTPVLSGGSRWGVSIQNGTLLSGTELTEPHLKHDH